MLIRNNKSSKTQDAPNPQNDKITKGLGNIQEHANSYELNNMLIEDCYMRTKKREYMQQNLDEGSDD